jgi:hypothetical protein
MILKCTIFWDVMPCSLVEASRLLTACVLSLLSDPEYEGSKYLRNLSKGPSDFMCDALEDGTELFIVTSVRTSNVIIIFFFFYFEAGFY